MSQRTKQLICEGLPTIGITEAKLRSTFENQLQQLNGNVVDITCIPATNSVVISFETPEAVESILNRGSSVEIGSTWCHVKAFYGKNEETAAESFMQNPEKGNNFVWCKNGMKEMSNKEQAKPASRSHSLLIEGLPSKDMNEDRLKFFFKNKRNRVPGKVSSVSYNPAANSAIVVFEQVEAVELILSRGSTVEIDLTQCSVQAVTDAKEETVVENNFQASKSSKGPLCFEEENISWNLQAQNEQKQTKMSSLQKKQIDEASRKQQARRDTCNNASILENILASSVESVIVRVKVKNVFKGRDSYVLYFESINQRLEIDEENMILDALNKFVYVPFMNRKDLHRICDRNHADANILEISIVTKGDIDFYGNCVSLHIPSGSSLSIEELKSFVMQQTGEVVTRVRQADEPRSVIFAFDQSSKNAHTMTWNLCKKEGDKLVIAAPVQKTKSVLVQNVQEEDKTDLTRYMSNEKRSQGGEIESIENYKSGSYIVNFKDTDSALNVSQKEHHKLNGNILQVDFFFHCLSSKTWKRYFEENTHPCLHGEVHFQDRDHEQLEMEKLKEKNGADKGIISGKEVQIICAIDEKSIHNVVVMVLKGTGTLLIVNQNLVYSMRQSNVKMYFENDTSELDTIYLKFDFPQKVKAHVCKANLKRALKSLEDQIKSMIAFKYTGQSANTMRMFHHDLIEWRKHPQHSCPEGVKVIFYPNSPEFVVIGPKEKAEHFNNKVSNYFRLWLSEISGCCPSSNEPDCPQELHQNGQLTLNYQSKKPSASKDLMSSGMLSQEDFDRDPEKISSELESANKQTKMEMPVDESEYESLKINLDQYKLALLNHGKFHETFMQENKDVTVVIDLETKAVVLKADKKNAKKHYAELMSKMHEYDLKFDSAKVEDLDSDTLKLIQNECFQEKFEKLMNTADLLIIIEYLHDGVKLRCDKSERNGVLEKAKAILYNLTEQRAIREEHFMILKSKIGKEFISQFCSSVKAECVNVKFDTDTRLIIITGLPQERKLKLLQLENFLQKNEIATVKVPFSQAKKDYIAKFLKKEYDEIVSHLNKDGAKCNSETGDEEYVLKGLKDAVKDGEMKLILLGNKIVCQETVERFYGIKEFLSETTGQQLLKQAEKHSCMVIRKKASNATSMVSKGSGKQPLELPTLIARSTFMNCGIDILQGDITAIQGVDVVVVPLPRTLQCISGVSKAISNRGGPKIQSELKDVDSADVEYGHVINTTAGQLAYRSVYHIIFPVWSGEPEARDLLVNGLKKCLHQASEKGHSSVVIPALGTGAFKFPASVATMIIKNAVEKHLQSNSNLRRILLCDMTDSNVTEFKNRCEHWGLEEVNDVRSSDLKGSVSVTLAVNEGRDRRGPRGQGLRMSSSFDFGQISVKVISGQITKQKTDAIVTTVDKSLDLNKGKVSQAVLEFGGDSIQEDLQSNFPDGIKSGQFATSIGGNLQCQIIFHACLSRFRGGDMSKLETLVYDILKECSENNVATISFPALGTGNLGYPADVCAQSILKAISKLSKTHPQNPVKAVTIVIFPSCDDVKAAFSAALNGDSAPPAIVPKEASKLDFGSLKVLVKKGDLLQESCNAIVCGIKDSMNLASSGAVGKAILSKCGQDCQDVCLNEQANMQQDGTAVVSVEGLKCDQVIFVSMEKYSRHWDKGVTAVLKSADDLGIKSIAFPALGTRAKQANLAVIKKQIFSALESYGKEKSNSVQEVKIVIFDDRTLAAFVGSDQSAPSPMKASPKHMNDHPQATFAESKVSEKETLQFLYVKGEAFKQAQHELNSTLVKTFQSNTIKEKELMKLSDSQVRKLEMEGKKLFAKVIVDKDAGVVTIRSFWPSALLSLTNKVHNSVQEVIKSVANMVPLAVQWQYEQGDKMKDFDKELSITIEAAFKKKSPDIEILDSKNHKYIVIFSSMKEFPVDDDGRVSKHGITIKRVDLTQGGEPLPKKWDPMNDSENLKVVTVKPGSTEYKHVESSYKAKGATFPIKKIERIQNKALYRQYIVKKKLMDSTNPKGHQNEKRLYHGTDAATVQAVNENGFSRNYCGKNATAYGEGVYFAEQSSYSVNYAQPDTATRDRRMYQVRVLVGESTRSSSGMRFLPNKPGSNTPYDSGTGSSGMYIIFHDSQTYPEYLITF